MQEIAFQRLNISKFFRGSMSPDPPRCSRAFGARLSTLLFSPWWRHWLACQSSVHTTTFVLASIFWDNFSSSVCLCVGYKMKTCTQISDCGFRGKINVVNPGRRAGFSHVNARRNTRASTTKRAGPPPYRHPPIQRETPGCYSPTFNIKMSCQRFSSSYEPYTVSVIKLPFFVIT